MDTLALRLAAGGGTLDGHAASVLVAAGFTLLQRSPALVRALGRGRSAILLPPSPQFLVALAASEGRAALVLDPNLGPAEIAEALRVEDAGAVLTLRALARRLPERTATVLLDDAPRRATVVASEGTETVVDLGTHFGLMLEGTADAPGREEECLVTDAERPAPQRDRPTHRRILDDALHVVATRGFDAGSVVRASWDWSRSGPLVGTLLAPLLAGAEVITPGSGR